MGDRAGPLDLAKGRVNRHEPMPRDNAREQDRHGLRILASRRRDRHQRTAPDHLPAFGRHRDFEGGIPASAGPRVHAWRPSWSVRTMSSVTEMNSGEITYSGWPLSCRGRSDGHGGDRGRGPARKETGKQAEVPGLAGCQGLERAAMVFCNVGGHGGCLPGGGAGGPFSGPRVRPDDAGRELLKAGCGHAATDEPGALAGKGRARCADPEPDRYSRYFVLPVKGAAGGRSIERLSGGCAGRIFEE